jgi:damage-control phosphatase, subfamily I
MEIMIATINEDQEVISDYRCFFCFARAFERLIEKENLQPKEKKQFANDMFGLFNDVKYDFSIPEVSRDLHVLLKQYSNNPDPYKEDKKQSNDLVLGMYSELKDIVFQSGNYFDTALRLAIAGNIIDFGISNTFDLHSTIDKVLNSEFAIDDSLLLKQSLSKAKTVLYLGDNCGEMVFDKLFIETMMHPNLIYAVRGEPVINDVTLDDAKYVGMELVASVISNGYDAPSTLLDHCSSEFLEVFNRADVIISKGQGNLEGLLGKTTKDIYFLLMVKCEVIADVLGVRKGDFVVKKNNIER